MGDDERIHIVLIDEEDRDHARTARALRREFVDFRLVMHEVVDAAQLAERLASDAPDLVVVDSRLRWSDGIAVLQESKKRWHECPVLMIVDSANEKMALAAMGRGLDDYITVTPTHLVPLAARARFAIERSRARRRSAELLQRLDGLLDQLDVGIFRCSLAGRLLEANPAYLRILGIAGLEEAAAEDLLAYARPEDRRLIQETFLREGLVRDLQLPLRRKDGEVVWVEVNATRVKTAAGESVIDGMVDDITERKRAEELIKSSAENLNLSHRLEALGRLAGGVAHDFNNLLTAITVYCDLAIAELRSGDPVRENVEAVKRTSERAAALIRELVAFAGRQVLKPQILDLNAVVNDLQPMLRRLISEDIKMVFRLDPELSAVNADPTQIEQVVVNLVLNARDFMPSGGGLTLETTNVELTQQQARSIGRLDAGAYAVLRVSDTGAGMTPEVSAHALEPFFTTRPDGHGSGLGLAVTDGIVKQSGGAIRIESEPGSGTSIEVYLPEASGVPELKRPQRGIAEPRQGSETVLVVEDDDTVRRAASNALEHAGYRVLCANSGEEACTLVESGRQDIHLLLSDVVMEGMGVRELVDRVRLRHPEIKVLCTSGYSEDMVLNRGIGRGEIAFLPKPFSIVELATAVRTELDS